MKRKLRLVVDNSHKFKNATPLTIPIELTATTFAGTLTLFSIASILWTQQTIRFLELFK